MDSAKRAKPAKPKAGRESGANAGSSGGMDADKAAEARRFSEAMRDLMNISRTRFEDSFRESGITLAQLRLLKAVKAGSEQSAASLARQCHVTPQTLHTMLTRAAREGWITRGSSTENRRFVTAELTPMGEALYRQGARLREEMETAMWQAVPFKAIRQARKTLEAGIRNLQQAAEDEG